jgi:hypothetical protein
MPARGFGQSVVEHAVGVLALVPHAEVVRLVVEDRIDLRRAHELLQLDQPGTFARRGGDLVLGQQHVLAGLHLVAVGDLLVVHLLALLGADPFLLTCAPSLAWTW